MIHLAPEFLVDSKIDRTGMEMVLCKENIMIKYHEPPI